jgi:hypothetical protein
MRVGSRAFIAACLLLSLMLLTGCGEQEKIYDVSGTVTYNGKPVAKGLIFFDPDASKGTGGGQGFANIVDGKYNTAEMGQGVRGGAYHVRVNGFDGKEANDAPFGQALFPEYTGTTELPQANSTYDLDVPTKRRIE